MTMQLYLNHHPEENILIKNIEGILGEQVETVDYPKEEASIFMMLDFYDTGFGCDINLSWPETVEITLDELTVAKRLAILYQSQVALALPKSHPSFGNPYIWRLVDKDGEIVHIMEEDLHTEAEGLVLKYDKKSKQM